MYIPKSSFVSPLPRNPKAAEGKTTSPQTGVQNLGEKPGFPSVYGYLSSVAQTVEFTPSTIEGLNRHAAISAAPVSTR